MTREEAIKGLKVLAKDFSGYRPNEEMFNMAIEALEQPEIIRCKDCNKASKCFGDIHMITRGGGYICCPLEFCSEAERRTDEVN